MSGTDVVRFRERRFLACFAVLAVCGHATSVLGQVAVPVPGTRVSVVVPHGFDSAKLFPGFQQVDTGSSIVITEMPAPFDTFRGRMTKEGLAAHGMTLLSTERVRIAAMDGLLIAISQEVSGIAYRKWLGVFGNDSATVMVAAAFPETDATRLSEPLKRSVMSVTWNSAADVGRFDGLTFRLQETATLKIANRMSNLLMLTRGGKPGPVPPDEPLMIVASSISEVEIGDVEPFAKSRLMQTAEVKEIDDIQGESLTIGGVRGYEIVATAKDARSGTVLRLYQVIAVKGRTYYLVQGVVGESTADQYLAEFRAVARSLFFVE